MSTSRTVIIAGAGIGGLTAALALAQNGLRVLVLEQASRLEETGAGLQLSPNAAHVLIELGLAERLKPRVVAPEAIRVRQAASGRDLVTIGLSDAQQEYGAPYWVIHRADLQGALLSAVEDHPDIVVELGARVQDFAAHPNGVTVAWLHKSGTADATGMALVGADGLWSTIRARMGDSAPPRAAGRTAWRTLVPAEAVADEFRAPVVQLWMGPGAHLVHYPVRAGRAINIVAISTDGWKGGPGWSTGSERDELMAHFPAGAWAKPARALLETPPRWLKWGLYDRPPLRRWSRGAVTLLGDAAHPMLPFLAQGAAMAIEDAAVLAASLARANGVSAAPAALRRYEAQRRARTARVQEAARANDRIYHLGGPFASVRDFALRVVLGGDVVARRYDWIYHWRPPERAMSGS